MVMTVKSVSSSSPQSGMAIPRLLVGCFIATVCSMMPLLFTLQGSILLLFFSRVFVESAFNVTYVYTPEAYPTFIRTYALGVANVFSRLGGIVAPFVSQDLLHLTKAGPPRYTILVFLVMSVVGGFAATLIPRETKGLALSDEEVKVENKTGKLEGESERLLFAAGQETDEGFETP